MKVILYFGIAITLLGVISTSTVKNNAVKTKQKNVLFIAVDDLKPILGCYGDESVISPNIDKLAEQGTVFLNNHCQQAVCAPSRASLLTGLRPDNTKVWDLKTIMRDHVPNVLTLPQYFRQNGYETVALGKIFDSRSVDKEMDKPSWSIPYNEVNKFQYNSEYGTPFSGRWQLPATKEKMASYAKIAREKGLNGRKQLEYILRNIKPSTEIVDAPDEAYPDGQATIRAIELLKKMAKKEKPFFLAIGYKKPHLPFTAPKKYWDLYSRAEFQLASWQEKPINAPDIAMHNWGELKSYSDIKEHTGSNGFLDAEKQRELIHGYYACVSFIDAQIGELLGELKKLGLEKNTIIVLWGDHGWHLGDHGLWCKHSNFEQATRSPLIIIDPNIDRDNKTDAPTEFIDIFPTLTELTNLPTPEVLEGVSLVPLMRNQAKSVKEFAVSQYPRSKDVMGYAIRTKQYRYIEWHKNDYRNTKKLAVDNVVGTELYDYEKDPLEKQNFANDKEYAMIQKELKQKMQLFLRKSNNED